MTSKPSGAVRDGDETRIERLERPDRIEEVLLGGVIARRKELERIKRPPGPNLLCNAHGRTLLRGVRNTSFAISMKRRTVAFGRLEAGLCAALLKS